MLGVTSSFNAASLNIVVVPLADEYTDEEIIKIVESTRGQIEGKIIRE
jgi:hypothetical protein